MNNNNTQTDVLGHSPDALAQRKAELLALLAQTAPELISDQQLNIDKLKALLGDERISGDEHYELSWAGKSAARREIQKTSSHTLRPDANNPAQAQHMLIEGENLEVLRVLQKSYYGKVKMIYIDPPYNTGNDSFVYPDDYSETLDNYQKRTGEKNEAGFLNKQSLWKKNSKESGQYHSAWLSMMYPRLYLARNLLSDDGVIFISIDDNEVANLRLLCDEIFGSENFVTQIEWQKRYTRSNNTDGFTTVVEHILCYGKYDFIPNLLDRTEEANSRYQNPDNDHRGPWKAMPFTSQASPSQRPNLCYPIKNPKTGEVLTPKNKAWRSSKEVFEKYENENQVWWGVDGSSSMPSIKKFLSEARDGMTPINFWAHEFAGNTDVANREIKEVFGETVFDTPKPTLLIRRMIELGTDKNDLILDFFAGSGTTAHAVMLQNFEDGGARQSISVQMPEKIDITREAFQSGYRTISDITKTRIEKVIDKLKSENPDKTTDLACAHFTLAPSNFKVWRGDANSAEALREQLALFQTAEKPGAQNAKGGEAGSEHQAMLAELLLKHGLGALGVHAISAPKKLAGVTVQRVLMPDNRHMWLCFDPYTEALKAEITQAAPAQVVMLNSCFQGAKADELLANLQLELAGLEIGLTVI
jgi:adenine-specific DNA-methyltransferase